MAKKQQTAPSDELEEADIIEGTADVISPDKASVETTTKESR